MVVGSILSPSTPETEGKIMYIDNMINALHEANAMSENAPWVNGFNQVNEDIIGFSANRRDYEQPLDEPEPTEERPQPEYNSCEAYNKELMEEDSRTMNIEDLRIDTINNSNTVGMRIIHIPTGLSVNGTGKYPHKLKQSLIKEIEALVLNKPQDDGYSVCSYDAELELEDDIKRREQSRLALLSHCRQQKCSIEDTNVHLEKQRLDQI